VNVTRGSVIAERVTRADGFWARLIGLIGRRSLDAGEGLWLIPCNGVHTFGMRFPIDVLILDRDRRVLRVLSALRPWRLCLPAPGGHSAIELPAGTIAASNVRVGDQLTLEIEPQVHGEAEQL